MGYLTMIGFWLVILTAGFFIARLIQRGGEDREWLGWRYTDEVIAILGSLAVGAGVAFYWASANASSIVDPSEFLMELESSAADYRQQLSAAFSDQFWSWRLFTCLLAGLLGAFAGIQYNTEEAAGHLGRHGAAAGKLVYENRSAIGGWFKKIWPIGWRLGAAWYLWTHPIWLWLAALILILFAWKGGGVAEIVQWIFLLQHEKGDKKKDDAKKPEEDPMMKMLRLEEQRLKVEALRARMAGGRGGAGGTGPTGTGGWRI